MKQGKLRTLEGGKVAFYCPGCQMYHAIHIEGPGYPRWDFNGNYESPTFTPSIRVETGHYPEPSDLCHSFVIDGKIQYLGDSTHALAGQTVDMQDEVVE